MQIKAIIGRFKKKRQLIPVSGVLGFFGKKKEKTVLKPEIFSKKKRFISDM